MSSYHKKRILKKLIRNYYMPNEWYLKHWAEFHNMKNAKALYHRTVFPNVLKNCTGYRVLNYKVKPIKKKTI